MSVADALQIMLMFGTFVVSLIALVVEIVKKIKKNNRLSLWQASGY
ncbi:putative holin-like toxin [Apilactobacillus timberlakei]|nr:putative holin-like toxin [Apilactobacillus timberlakei]TPR21571.1 putative holin-like toxin [Apilactobacillus timberlakei]